MAKEYLLQKGHVILEQNYRYNKNEVDIISIEKDLLVFSEIKTRSSYRYGFPEEAVRKRKQDALKKVALAYQFAHPKYQKIRFDVISLLVQKGKLIEIFHFEDAFY